MNLLFPKEFAANPTALGLAAFLFCLKLFKETCPFSKKILVESYQIKYNFIEYK